MIAGRFSIILLVTLLLPDRDVLPREEEHYSLSLSQVKDAGQGKLVQPAILSAKVNATRIKGGDEEEEDVKLSSLNDARVCFSSRTENDDTYVLLSTCLNNATRVIQLGIKLNGILNGQHALYAWLVDPGRGGEEGVVISNVANMGFHVHLEDGGGGGEASSVGAKGCDRKSRGSFENECSIPRASRLEPLLDTILGRLGDVRRWMLFGSHLSAEYMNKLILRVAEKKDPGHLEAVFSNLVNDGRLVKERIRGGDGNGEVDAQQRRLLQKKLFLSIDQSSHLSLTIQDDKGKEDDGGHQPEFSGDLPNFVMIDGSVGDKMVIGRLQKWLGLLLRRSVDDDSFAFALAVSNYSSCAALSRAPHNVAVRSLTQHAVDAVITKEDELVFFSKKGYRSKGKLAIIVASIVHGENTARPWTEVTIARIKKYAKKCNARLIIEAELEQPCSETESRICSMRHKLTMLRRHLREYDRVLMLDDTVLIREDTPDLFAIVPEGRIGGVLEEYRGEERIRRILDGACEFYGVNRTEFSGSSGNKNNVVNTGVLLLSRRHHFDLLFNNGRHWNDEAGGVEVEEHLFGDQGYVNAMLQKKEFDFDSSFLDLGPRFNFVGSFENINRNKVDFLAEESYIAHATTGLLLEYVGDKGPGLAEYRMMTHEDGIYARRDYLKKIDWTWEQLGL